MGGFWGSIVGWFAKSFLGNIFSGEKNSLLDRILTTVDKQVGNDTEREKLKTEVTLKYLQSQVDMSLVRKDAFGPWAWMMAALFLPGPVIWWNCVFIDSAWPHLFPGWDPLALPPDFYPWMTTVIGALFFVPTINKWVSK